MSPVTTERKSASRYYHSDRMTEFNIRSVNASGGKYPASLLEIKSDGKLEPSELENIVILELPVGRGLIISGRAPVWVFSYLTEQYCRNVPWVATFDPSLKGAVVTATRSENTPSIGEVVTLPKSKKG